MDKIAIGGYFELELSPTMSDRIYEDAYSFQSARAAFYALISAGKPHKVWIPKYICDSMISPLELAKIDYDFYEIDEFFNIKDNFRLSGNDWLLYVNYFGMCSQQERDILKNYSPDQVVFDHSQALFKEPVENCVATIYSLRKFLGVPDGGLMYTKYPIKQIGTDETSMERISYLLRRIEQCPESGYKEFVEAEKTLENISTKKMSVLTEKILRTVDTDYVRVKRNNNFFFLEQKLSIYNEFIFDLKEVDGPLCYPFLFNKKGLREYLKTKRIFIPKYWPDIENRVKEHSFEKKLFNYMLPIPCDHRYSVEDMNRLSHLIFKFLKNNT